MDKTTAAIKRQRFTTTIGTLISPSDNSPLSTLPFHLLEEILCRLPVKFLVQLQCICKSWQSLISDNPNFAKKHLQMSLSGLHQTHHHLILNSTSLTEFLGWYLPVSCSTYWESLPISSVFNDASKVRRLHLPILNTSVHNNGIVGSCHGIICVPIKHCIIFWNPSTGRHKLSPSFENARYYGFGYDDLNDKYKAVIVDYYVDESVSNDDDDIMKTIVMVHTLGTNCWRRIQPFPCGRGLLIDKTSKFIGGSVHWLMLKDEDEGNNSLFFVVSLDLRSESYQEILQPDYGDQVNVVSLTLGVSRDCLCIFAQTERYIDLWCMKEYGKKESWGKLFTIPFPRHLCYRDFKIDLAYIYEDEQVLLCIHAYKPRWVVYDSKSKTSKIPCIGNINGRRIVPIDYVESLVTPCF